MNVSNLNNINNLSNVEDFFKMQIMTQMLKSTLGDSPAFSVVMESMMKAFDGLSGDKINAIKDGIKEDIKVNNLSIEEAIDRASKKYNIDKDLIKAVIKQESDFDPRSTSNKGAMGLMQLMPCNVEEYGITDPYDINENIDGGTRQLRDLLDMYGNCKELALAAYNAGPTALRRKGINTIPDISKLSYETRDYVQKVMKYYGK